MNCKSRIAARIVLAFTVFFTMAFVVLLVVGPLKSDAVRLANSLMVGITSQNAYAATLDDESVFASKVDYRSMNADEQDAYARMYDAVSKRAETVEFEDQDVDWIFDMFLRMRLDSPELFYVNDDITVTTHETTIAFVTVTTRTVKFDYLYDAETIDAMQARIDEMVSQTCNGVWDSAPESFKASLINDAVISMAAYDLEDSLNEETHTIVGTMLEGQAVCEGYAQAFTLLSRACGLECRTVVGDVPQTADDPTIAHAWNAVNTENGWRYVDSCWNDVAKDHGRYLLMDDGTMAEKGYQQFENNLRPC